MKSNFIYILDKTLAEKYQSEGFLLLKKTFVNNSEAWLFSVDKQKLNFSLEDKNKILITNKLFF